MTSAVRAQTHRFVKAFSQTLSPKCMLGTLVVLTFLYALIYLLWSRTASEVYHSKLYAQEKSGRKPIFSGDTGVVAWVEGRHKPEEIQYVPEGEGVWIGSTKINLVSAIHDIHHAGKGEMRVVFTGFLRHSAPRDFVCCFSSSSDPRQYVQVSSRLDYIDLRFLAEFQNAVFECLVGKKNGRHLDSVFFAPESCDKNPTASMRIVFPVLRSFEYAVCTKVAYSRLDPSRLVEWFEVMREVGASKIVTFTNNIHPDTLRVLKYYQKTGFVDLIDYRPRSQHGIPAVLLDQANGQLRQSRHDKTLVVRDCQFRLAGYEYIMTVDFDELPVPQRPYGTVNILLSTLAQEYPNVSAFRMDPILLPPEWKSREDRLYHWQFETGTYIGHYCTKWIYKPARTLLATTHENVPRKGFQTIVVPQKMVHLLHFRECKEEWRELNCDNLTQTVNNEASLHRFGHAVLMGMKSLPLEELIPDHEYVRQIRSDHRSFSAKEKQRRKKRV